MNPLPWHDTAPCPRKGCGGPVVPFVEQSQPPHLRPDARHVNCSVCGHDYTEHDPTRLAQIWWSYGAYEGSELVRKAKP